MYGSGDQPGATIDNPLDVSSDDSMDKKPLGSDLIDMSDDDDDDEMMSNGREGINWYDDGW